VWTFDNIFPPGSVLWWLVMSNTLVLAWRSVMKYLKVDEIYGPIHGLLSVPRFFVSNLINFTATCRAISQYVVHKLTGEPLRWLKTAHAFPDAEILRTYRRRIGDLLQDNNALTEEDLSQALALQRKTGLKLGQVLSISGMVAPRAVTEAIAEQFALPLVEPDPFRIPLLLLRRLSEVDSVALGALPLDLAGEDRAWLAVSEPASPSVTEKLEGLLGMTVSYCFVPEPKLDRARDRAYRRLVMESEGRPQKLRLGERLVAAGRISEEQLKEALEEQVRTGERLGELLLRQSLITAPILAAAIGGASSAPFRTIHPRDVDPVALARIGYGLAALYRLVPLHLAPGSAAVSVVSASPLHDEVVAILGERLGCSVVPMLGPSLDIRLGLAVAAREAWPQGIAGGLGGIDGCELEVFERTEEGAGGVEALVERSTSEGRSPLAQLLADRMITPGRAAQLRAASLGIGLAAPKEGGAASDTAWLPPGLVNRAGLELVEMGGDHLVVASSRPTARLAREISTLFPDAAIAWRVASSAEFAQESADLADALSGEHSLVGAPGGL
jgi:hypothetical protein